LSTPDFLNKVVSGDTVTYQADGIDFQIDFSTHRWQLNIDGNAFDPEMAPQGGESDIQVKVAGGIESDQTRTIKEHLTNLSFTGS